jgi:glycine cleavage system H protein
MTEYLETIVDKFTFRVATGRAYSREGMWALAEGDRVRVGLSDFVQQRSGDVAFAEVKLTGAHVARGDDLATIETIKVNVSLASPISGVVAEINPALSRAPEVINQDPYGQGWLAVLIPDDWPSDRSALQDPDSYFAQMKLDAEQEAGRE